MRLRDDVFAFVEGTIEEFDSCRAIGFQKIDSHFQKHIMAAEQYHG